MEHVMCQDLPLFALVTSLQIAGTCGSTMFQPAMLESKGILCFLDATRLSPCVQLELILQPHVHAPADIVDVSRPHSTFCYELAAISTWHVVSFVVGVWSWPG